MPVNFQLNFVEPLLLDIQNGNIPDMDTFSGKIAEYYERTILLGAPQVTTPILPAPALSGAPTPIADPTGMGAGDGYKKPGSYNSTLRMYRSVARYYVGRELIMGEQDLQSTIETLGNIYQEQNFNVKRVKALVKKAQIIKDELKTLPEKVKDIAAVAEVLMTEYKTMLKAIRDEFTLADFATQAATGISAQASTIFKEEYTIIDTILNLKVDNLKAVANTIQVVNNYSTKFSRFQDRTQQQQKQLVVSRIKIILNRIKEVLATILEPTSFGPLLTRLASDKPEVQAKIDKAKKAYRELKQAEELLRPSLLELERRIKEEKTNFQLMIKRRVKDIKKRIEKKQVENGIRRAQKAALTPSKAPKQSPIKDLIKNAKKDIETLKKNNEKNIKLLKKKTKLIGTITRDTTNLTKSMMALKDSIILTEIPLLEAKFAQVSGSVVEILGTSQALGFNQNQQGTLNQAGTQAKETYNQLRSSIKTASNKKDEKYARRYFREQGLQDVAEPFVALFLKTNITFQDFRVFMEKTDKRYDEYINTIKGFNPKIKSIVDAIRSLDDEGFFIEPVDQTTDTYKQRQVEWETRQKIRRQAQFNRAAIRLSPVELEKLKQTTGMEVAPLPSRGTLITVLRWLLKTIQKVTKWLSDGVKKVKKYIEKQKQKAIQIAKELRIQALAAIPIPVDVQDSATTKEIAEEKQKAIKAYQTKIQTLRNKGEAIALVSTAAIPLVTNIGDGKLKASDNEKWLKQIGLGIFKYETVGVKNTDPSYTRSQEQKELWDKNVSSLQIIENLVDLVVKTGQDIKESSTKLKKLPQEGTQGVEQFGRGFIDDLKVALTKIQTKVGKRPDGTIGSISDVASNRIVSIIIDLFADDITFEVAVKKIKQLRVELSGKVLSSLLQSVDFTQALIDVEQKYLYNTRRTIQKITGALRVDTNQDEEENSQDWTGVPIAKKDAEIRKKAKAKADEYRKQLQKLNIGGFNFYDEMIKLDRMITKRNGSFIAAVIDRLIWGINYFETKVRNEVKKWIKEKREETTLLLKKTKEQHKDKLAKLKQKVANVEGLIQAQVLGLSARIFWTGATWQNTYGTTFQVLSIGQFPRLKVVGLKEGGRAVIEEIAKNFQKQLDSMSIIAFPNPSYGIPPQLIKGYK